VRDFLWLLRRFWLLALLVIVPAGVGLCFERSRLDTVVEIWSSLAVGLFLWIVLGYQGDPVLRRFWLRRNAEYVIPHIREIRMDLHCILATFGIFVGPVVDAETLTGRKQAIAEIRELIRTEPPGPESWFPHAMSSLEDHYTSVSGEVSHAVMSGLADLQASAHRFGQNCRSVLRVSERIPQNLPVVVPMLLLAVLDLWDTCSEITAESGALEKG
jgi:hypothetical protein